MYFIYRCSPEVLGHKKFSTKADVWSYGIVMWEGFTHSKPPKLVTEVKYLHSEMDKGKRLSKPDQCPPDVYSLMRQCWEREPDNRPDFVAIEKRCRYVSIAGVLYSGNEWSLFNVK